jgi:hypothetical protein
MPDTWFIMENNLKVGPITSTQVEQMVTAGRIRSDTMVWREGLPQWYPAGGVSDLPGRAALAIAVPPPPPVSYTTVVAADDAAWGGGAMTGLVIATLFIPLVGLIIGPMNMNKAARKGQGLALLIVGIVMVLVYVVGAANS